MHENTSSIPGQEANVLRDLQSVDLPLDEQPHLIVVVDTEEEFDWFAEPDVDARAVSAINSLHLVQDIFDEYDIVPCYVVDYAIASQAESVAVLKEVVASRRCDIGAHLHPWVNPPHQEELCRSNMYPGNLTYELEYEKLAILTSQIGESFGEVPTIYKAGRYGVGANTAEILNKLGYEIDLSFCPPFDYRDDGGPDYSDAGVSPGWFGVDRRILEIPVTGAFVGVAGGLSKYLYRAAGRPERLRLRGVLSRLNIVDRLMLSPEGYSPSEHRKLARFLISKGVRTLTWNFHSPTVVPGMTMYTQSDKDLNCFLDSFRQFFDFFFQELKGVATTPTRLKSKLEHQS